jgi:DNA-binding XRE family transcriptional regulator
MAAKTNHTNPDVGIILGSDGRLRAVVDFEYIAKLVELAAQGQGTNSNSDDVWRSIRESATKLKGLADFILEDEDAIDRATIEATEHEETIPWEMTKRMVNGESPIRVWRQHRGLRQKALAEMVGTKPVYISQIETGAANPSLKLVGKIAKALDVTIDDLVN